MSLPVPYSRGLEHAVSPQAAPFWNTAFPTGVMKFLTSCYRRFADRTDVNTRRIKSLWRACSVGYEEANGMSRTARRRCDVGFKDAQWGRNSRDNFEKDEESYVYNYRNLYL